MHQDLIKKIQDFIFVLRGSRQRVCITHWEREKQTNGVILVTLLEGKNNTSKTLKTATLKIIIIMKLA